jgi:hypothetical protein
MMARSRGLLRLCQFFISSVNLEIESKISEESGGQLPFFDDENGIIPKIFPECILNLVASDPSTLKEQ